MFIFIHLVHIYILYYVYYLFINKIYVIKFVYQRRINFFKNYTMKLRYYDIIIKFLNFDDGTIVNYLKY